jgi:hypothetical protein
MKSRGAKTSKLSMQALTVRLRSSLRSSLWVREPRVVAAFHVAFTLHAWALRVSAAVPQPLLWLWL